MSNRLTGAVGMVTDVDLVGEAISAMRTGEPQAARALLTPPWGLRFTAAGGAGVQVILRGTAWLLPPNGGDPIHMAAGDVALVRREQPHGMADDPSTPLYDVTLDEHDDAEHWPRDGSAMDDRVPGTVLIGATYHLNGARPHPLLESLPDVIHLPARIGAAATVRTVVELLGAEMDIERPGVSAAVPALLDLLLLYTMRTWLESTTQPVGWARALQDPALSAALRAIQHRPDLPWTVASLAGEASLSRAAFARRFTALTGQPPLTYLTWVRMTLASRLLQTTDAPMQTIAGRVGYSSEYAFSKAFKRELGLAPAHYRRRQRAAGEAL
jgi:AraC-like DNA-binding protein